MIFKRTYGFWSLLLGILGVLFLILNYIVLPDNPEGISILIIRLLLGSSLISFVTGIICSIIAIKKRERGIKKYFGIIIPLFTFLFILFIPILMGILFVLNDP